MSSYLPLFLAPSFNPLHPVKSIQKNALIPGFLPTHLQLEGD